MSPASFVLVRSRIGSMLARGNGPRHQRVFRVAFRPGQSPLSCPRHWPSAASQGPYDVKGFEAAVVMMREACHAPAELSSARSVALLSPSPESCVSVSLV